MLCERICLVGAHGAEGVVHMRMACFVRANGKNHVAHCGVISCMTTIIHKTTGQQRVDACYPQWWLSGRTLECSLPSCQ